MKMVLPDGNRPSRSPCLGILPPQLIVVVPFGHVREKRGIEGRGGLVRSPYQGCVNTIEDKKASILEAEKGYRQNNHPALTRILDKENRDLVGPFSGAAFYQPLRLEAFFSFEEGCTFHECALMVEKDSWESSLSQMTISIIGTGDSQPSSKAFFFIIIYIVQAKIFHIINNTISMG